MSDTNSTAPASTSPVVSVENLVKNPKSIMGWGGLLISIGTMLETNATASWEGWLVSIGTLATSALTIILPSVVKK